MVCNLPISEESLTMIKQATEVDNDLEKLKTGERLVIPYGVRSHIKARIHASHIGVQGCLRSARDSVYWPGMTKQLTEYILRCPTCNAYPQGQQKEPLISHAIPERPWEKLDQLRSKTSNEIIAKLKSLFARYGVPDQLITDNGPPYNSEAVREFAREFEFEHITSSPGYPKSNGKSENAVRTAKRLVKKARESGRDPYLSLLDWRNTRYQDCGT
ncbi:Transposon Ty3-I Gag-Pol poly [Paramuricea clavata]|uniref:Transposon Ty3-I Gag-Pol poly n=1 Tax=Paramuricea clavata TaxID=317549 RepID=A0A6S7GBU4_PARCT|nr:Transposon Ty3-I Gag-Pol poly [Paramuricea clavata]